jgi:hypothetical protein
MVIAVNAQPIELVLCGTTERIDIIVADAEGNPVDATGLIFELRRVDDTVIYTENFITAPARVIHPAVGKYYFPMGDIALVNGVNPETGYYGEFLAVWQVIGPAGSEQVTIVQKAWVVSTYSMALISDLRLQIDKSAKLVHDDPANPCYVGYTDSMLMQFLLNGLTVWNMYEPYPTFNSLDQFPQIYRQGLIDAALLVGVAAQELFAIDTDIPNYSAQGAAFVIQHQPQLASYLNRLAQRLDKLIPVAKLKMVRSGSVHVQVGANFRLTSLVQMAPNGAIFRNFMVSGG